MPRRRQHRFSKWRREGCGAPHSSTRWSRAARPAALTQRRPPGRRPLTNCCRCHQSADHDATQDLNSSKLLDDYASMVGPGCDITLALLPLPCGVMEPAARLRALASQTRRLKLSPRLPFAPPRRQLDCALARTRRAHRSLHACPRQVHHLRIQCGRTACDQGALRRAHRPDLVWHYPARFRSLVLLPILRLTTTHLRYLSSEVRSRSRADGDAGACAVARAESAGPFPSSRRRAAPTVRTPPARLVVLLVRSRGCSGEGTASGCPGRMRWWRAC